MNILSGVPVLQCRDINKTLNFYLEYLRFVVVNRRESDGVLQWIHIMNGDTSLMLESSAGADPASSSIMLFYFVDDIDAIHHYLRSRDVRVSDIEQTPYRMRVCMLQDPEGNTLQVGQSSGSSGAAT